MLNLRAVALAVGGLALLYSAAAHAVTAVYETPAIPSSGDADDPAFWLSPTDPSQSLVIATGKNAGLRVYDLSGHQLQSYLTPGKVDNVASRLNNVDVQYNFRLADGSRTDIAVFTDRGQDTLRVFKISASATPLTEITGYNRLFPTQPIPNQATGYGVALWRNVAADKTYALVAQRGGNGAGGFDQGRSVAQFELVAQAGGTVTSQFMRSWDLPTTYKGVDLQVNDQSPQAEGMVVDQQTGMLYVGQEDVGVWGINLLTGAKSAAPLIETVQFDASSPLTADVEGLTIRYGNQGEGLVLVSSQGDNTYAAFNRKGFGYLGSFAIVDSATIDGVQDSDGADITSFALPGYDKGLLVVQDGDNRTVGGAADDTNFKYLNWSDVTAENAFLAPYASLPANFDPRNIALVPEPASVALMLVGLGLLAAVRRRG